MKNIKKEYIKPFIYGCITTIIAIVLIYGGYKTINKIKNRIHVEKQNIIENNQSENNNENLIEIEGKKYIMTETKYDNHKCDEYNDVMYNNGAFFIKNDGTIYLLSDKKFSDTNQNCKLMDTKVKIKKVIGYNDLVGNDNKVYNFSMRDDISMSELKLTSDKYEKEWLQDDIVRVETLEHNEDYDKKKATKTYLVLKNDGKIYKYNYVGTWDNYNSQFNYRLNNPEVYLEYDGEKIKSFSIESEGMNSNFVITDKNIYLSYISNKECMEYTDVKCEYKFKKEEFLNKYLNEYIDYIRRDDNDQFFVTTYDKNISYTTPEYIGG